MLKIQKNKIDGIYFLKKEVQIRKKCSFKNNNKMICCFLGVWKKLQIKISANFRKLGQSKFNLKKVRKIFRNKPKLFKYSVATIILLVTVSTLYFQYVPNSQGASYTWLQTGWDADASAGSSVSHPDTTNKTTYDSKTNIVPSGAVPDNALQLTTNDGSVTQTDTTNSNTGFNLSGANNASTAIAGSGEAGNVSLSSETTSPVWERMATVPGTVFAGGSLVSTDGDFMYGYRGNSSKTFYRYSILGNSWTTMADAPGTIGDGGSLVYPGSGDYIYGYRGNYTKDFYRYSISGDSWTTLAVTPEYIRYGGSLVSTSGDYIYGYQGISSKAFYRYSISGNSWTTMAVTPGVIGTGGALVYPGSGDYIYGYRGNTSTDFYRYSISSNSWSIMAVTPATISASGGGALVCPGSGDYIYGYQGGSTAFYRYSISGNSWTTMAVTPANIGMGGALAYPGSGDYLYGYQGGNYTDFYRYAIKLDNPGQWASMAQSPTTMAVGTLVSTGGDYAYGYAGNNSTNFYRYSISGDSWAIMASTQGKISAGGSLVYPGSGDYIYGYQGNSTAFYRYSILGNSWTTMAVTPGTIGNGGALVYPGSGDYIYGYQGNSTAFYRYSISGDSWTTMAVTPGTIVDVSGGALVYPGSGDYIYGYQGNSTAFYRYSISGDSWTTMAVTPGTNRFGASLVYPGSGDYIYGYQGNNATAFYRYSILGDSWSTRAVTPGSISSGGSLFYPGSGDFIYGCRGANTSDFYRYSILGDSWTTMAVTPGFFSSAGGSLVYPGSGDYLYGYQGSSTTFYRYSISSNSWSIMAVTPGAIGQGGALVYPGSGDYIYGYGKTKDFYRYSISGNSWTTMAITPGGTFGWGAALVYPGSGDYIYGYQGGSTAFYRYSILGDSWTTMAVTPGTISSGGALVYPGSGDYIYGYKGGTTAFYRYSILGDSWTTIAVTPGSIAGGGSLVYPGSGDYIYGTQGQSTAFYRYSISGNSWTFMMTPIPSAPGVSNTLVASSTGNYLYGLGSSGNFYRYTLGSDVPSLWNYKAATPGIITNGGSLVYPGSGDYIYGYQGGSTAFYRYSITGDSWSTMAVMPGAIGFGGALVYPGSGDYIYGYQGGTTAFYRYSILGDSWTTMAVTPGTIGFGGALVYPGSGDYIYGYQGGTTAFYRYSILGDSWTTMAVTPGAISAGGSLVYPGSGDYLYGFRGGYTSNVFYRYSILGNSWSTMASTPEGISSGGYLVYPGLGDYIYGGSSTAFYRYSISGNSWTTMKSTPASIGSGGALVYPGSGPYLYGYRGGSVADFYSFSLLPYASSGTYTSGVINTGQKNLSWGNVSWNVNLNGQTMAIKARSCDDAACSAAGSVNESVSKAWGSCGTLTTGSNLASGTPNCVTNGDQYIQYQATLGTVDPAKSPILNDISLNFSYYSSSGNLISSALDSSSAANVMGNLLWTEDVSLPNGTASTVSLRSADSQANLGRAAWTDLTSDTSGCSKDGGIVTCTDGAIPAEFRDTVGDQWFQYKITLASDGASTPTVNDLTAQYVVNSPPEFNPEQDVSVVQLTRADSEHPGQVKIEYSIKDADASSGSFTPNYVTPTFEYSLDGGGNFTNFNQDNISFGDDPVGGARSTYNGQMTVKVLEGSYLTYTSYWNAKAAIDGNFSNQFKIRVKINDGESANNTATAVSNAASLDVQNPNPFAFNIDHPENKLTFYTPPTDDSSFQMMTSNRSDFADVSLQSYVSPYTYNIPPQVMTNDPATVHIRIEDNYGNQTDAQSVTPGKPMNPIYFDTSSSTQEIYQEFIAWDVLSASQVGAGFASYEIYRKINEGDFELLDSLTDRNSNYYLDKISGPDPAIDYSDPAFDPEAPSNYTYKILTTDINGNISAYSETINDTPNGTGGSDSTPPTISNVTVNNINTTSAKVNWTTDELSDSSVGFSSQEECESALDQICPYLPERGLSSMLIDHEIVLTGLTPGTDYHIRVKSRDVALNLGENDKDNPGATPLVNFSFSTQPGPAISNVTVPNIYNNQATISWKTTTDANTYVVYSDSIENGALVDPEEIGVPTLVGGVAPFDHTQTISTYKSAELVAGTAYYFYVKSVDGTGNVATDNNGGNFYQLLTTLDNDPPIVSEISVAIINSSQVAIHWITDEPADSKIIYTIEQGGPYESEEVVATYDASHFVIISGLESDTQYYYQVVSKDINGNEATSEEYDFTTLKDLEFQHNPLSEITDVASPPEILTDKNAVITFKTDQLALCVAEVTTSQGSYTSPIVYQEDGYEQKEKYNFSHAIKFTDLIFSTKYYYRLSCVDNLDNVVSSDEYDFTTAEQSFTAAGADALGDHVAPVISNVSAGTITGESMAVKWDTDEVSNSVVSFGTVSGTYDNMAGNDAVNSDKANFVTNHEVIINGLIPATKYYFMAMSTDATGNIGKSNEENFSTASPSSISSINVISTAINEASIAWKTSQKTTSSVEYGLVDTYGQIKTDSAMATEHAVAITSLQSNKVYHFRVKGKDALNNLYSSGDYTFTPKSPPVIAGIKATNITEHGAIIEFTTDVATDALVAYVASQDAKNTGSQGKPEFTVTHSIEIKNIDSGASFGTSIKVRDENGNETTQAGPTFTTGKDENPPALTNIKTDSALAQNDKVQTIISWTTDEPATSAITYQEGISGQQKELVISNNLSVSHVGVITFFRPGVVYYFKVKSLDQSDNVAESTDFALLTPRIKQNIIQIIVGNFQDIFSWAKR